ncbi:MAG: hypothetical protein LLG20_16975 [Acidobacteriales bacterium]|nr:hypothetical protein [Terriglobales bacterium]
MGLDLGQCSDYTAVAVVEPAELKGEWDPALFAWRKVVQLRVRYLERIALGTPYPDIVERIRHLTRSGELAGRCRVVADATGVGRPVIEMLQRADLGCRVMPVVVTGGDKEVQDGEYYRVPKRDLIAELQVLLQQGRLQIAAGLRDCETLVGEMAEMRVKITQAGNEQYGAWREGQHDDLVFAVALACWGARQAYPLDGVQYWQVPM